MKCKFIAKMKVDLKKYGFSKGEVVEVEEGDIYGYYATSKLGLRTRLFPFEFEHLPRK